MHNHLVSIILPIYNAQKYIGQTILSLLNQSYNNLEIIVVDDASTDNSIEIIKNFSDTRIKLITQSNSGAAIARNAGLKIATGEYIQFMDADDLISNNKIARQVEILAGREDKLALCNFIEFFDHQDYKDVPCKNQSSFIYTTDKPLEFLINLWGGNGTSNFIQTNCWLIPRKLIDEAGLWREYRCPDDDGEFFTRVLLKSNGIIYVPGCYNYYRRSLHESRLSNANSYQYLKNSLLTIDLKYKYLLEAGGHPLLKKAIARQYLNFSVYNYLKNKKLSKLAFQKYRELSVKLAAPKIGGTMIEWLKLIIGWKITLLIKSTINKMIYAD